MEWLINIVAVSLGMVVVFIGGYGAGYAAGRSEIERKKRPEPEKHGMCGPNRAWEIDNN